MHESPKTYAIYYNPSDFPGLFVVRAFACSPDGPKPYAHAYAGKTIEQVRQHIPQGLVRLERSKNDDPAIVEVWL